MIEEIIGAALGSAGIFTFVQYLIQRHDAKKGWKASVESRLEHIEKESAKSEKDALRTQLLLMIRDYPTETSEILRLAERYFGELKANWYLTPLFNKWLEEYKIAKPEWFKD